MFPAEPFLPRVRECVCPAAISRGSDLCHKMLPHFPNAAILPKYWMPDLVQPSAVVATSAVTRLFGAP
eukprot:6180258-Pleurochrysis_carterae.AAC.3